MKEILCKLFMPWRCDVYFEDPHAFFGFLVRRNKLCNTVRVVLFAVAAVLIFIGYNADGGGWSLAAVASHPYYLIAVGVLVLALLVSLVIIQNDKQLPEELRMK